MVNKYHLRPFKLLLLSKSNVGEEELHQKLQIRFNELLKGTKFQLEIQKEMSETDFDYVALDYRYFQSEDERNKFINNHINRLVLLVPEEDKNSINEILFHYKTYHFIKGRFDEYVDELQELILTRLYGKDRKTDCYFNLKGKVQSYEFCDSQSVQEKIDGVLKKVDMEGTFQGLFDFTRTLVNEMVTNAIFNSPIDEFGRQKYHHVDRKMAIMLSENEHVLLKVSEFEDSIQILVKDNFGMLSKEIIDKYMVREESVAQHEDRPGGAGLGLFIIFHYSSKVVIHVVPGESTEVICTVKKSKRFKNYFNNVKSFHCFVWREL